MESLRSGSCCWCWRSCRPRFFLVTHHGHHHYRRHRYFLVTHFADHGSLEQYVEKPFGTEQGDGGVTLRRRLSWTRQIALALHYIHRENFVHRAFYACLRERLRERAAGERSLV